MFVFNIVFLIIFYTMDGFHGVWYEHTSTPDSTSPPTSSCSSRRSSSSSTSTELCDEPGRMSDSDSLSDCYPIPDTTSTSKIRSLPECKEEECSDIRENNRDINNDYIIDDDSKSLIVSEPIDIVNNDTNNKKDFPEQELDKVLFPFDRDYLTKYGSEDSSDMCISSCPASPCVFPEEELQIENNEVNDDKKLDVDISDVIKSNDNTDIYHEKISRDEVIGCDNEKVELGSCDESNSTRNNSSSSASSINDRNQNKFESPITTSISTLSTASTIIRDSHSFHGISSFDKDNRYKIIDKRKSLQVNYKDRCNTDDEDLELRKIWLEKCNKNESSIGSNSNNNYNSNVKIDESILSSDDNYTITDNNQITFDDDLEKIISVGDNDKIDHSYRVSNINNDNTLSINVISNDKNIEDKTQLEFDEKQDEIINKTKNIDEFDTLKLKVSITPSLSDHSSITDDDCINIKESQQPAGRRGSEVQLNQILKENLEIIQKIQHTRRQKLSSSPPTASSSIMNEDLDIDIKKDVSQDNNIFNENTSYGVNDDKFENYDKILRNDNDIFDKLFLSKKHDNDNDEKTISVAEISSIADNYSIITSTTTESTLINDKNNDYYDKQHDDNKVLDDMKLSNDLIDDKQRYNKDYDETNIKKKSSTNFYTDEKSNSSVSLTEISSTDIDTSFESSFDNYKIDSIHSDEVINSSPNDLKHSSSYDKKQLNQSKCLSKTNFLTSTSSTLEDKDQSIIHRSFKTSEFDDINIASGGYSLKCRYGDDNNDKFNKYRGTSLNYETDKSYDDKKLSRLKNYYSFDYSPKSKVSSTSFYDINKRRTSYSLDSGTDLPLKISTSDNENGEVTKRKPFDDDDKSFWKSKSETLKENEMINKIEKDVLSDYRKSLKSDNTIKFDDIGATSSNYGDLISSSTNKYSKLSSDFKSDSLSSVPTSSDFQYQSSKLFDENSDDFLSKYITRKDDLNFKFSSASSSSSASLSRLESNRSIDSYLQPSSSPTKLQRSESLDTNEYIRSKSPRNIRRSLSPRYDLGKTLEESSDDFENWKIERSRESSPKLGLRRTTEENSDDFDRWKTRTYSRDSSPKPKDTSLGKSLTEISDNFDVKRRDNRGSRDSSPILRDLTKKLDDITSDDFDKWKSSKQSRESSPKMRDSSFGKSEDFSSDIEKYKSPYSHSRESSPKSRESSYLTKKYNESSSSDFDKWKSTKTSRDTSPIKSRDGLFGKPLQENSDNFEKWRTSKMTRETSPILRETISLRSDDIYTSSKSNEVSPKKISPDISLRNICSKSLLDIDKSYSSIPEEISKHDNEIKEMDDMRKKEFHNFQRTLATMERSSTLQDESTTDRLNKIKFFDELYLGKLDEIDNSFKILSKSQTLDSSYKTSSVSSSLDLAKDIKLDDKYSYKKYTDNESDLFDIDKRKTSKRFNSERRSTIHEYYLPDRFASSSSSSKFLEKNINDKPMTNFDLIKDTSTINEDSLTKSDNFKSNNDILYTTKENQQQLQQSNNLINKNINDDESSSSTWKSSAELKTSDSISSINTQQQYASSSDIKSDSTFNKSKQTSPISPTRFNPFPSRSYSRQPKEIGIKLGLYSPTKPTDSSKSKLSSDKCSLTSNTTTLTSSTSKKTT